MSNLVNTGQYGQTCQYWPDVSILARVANLRPAHGLIMAKLVNIVNNGKTAKNGKIGHDWPKVAKSVQD